MGLFASLRQRIIAGEKTEKENSVDQIFLTGQPEEDPRVHTEAYLLSLRNSTELVELEYRGPSLEALRFAREHESSTIFTERTAWSTEGREARKELAKLKSEAEERRKEDVIQYANRNLTLEERYPIGRRLGKRPIEIYDDHQLVKASIEKGFPLRMHYKAD